ncbi:hypothetical protein [Candidatus Tisiphia endosymbiont of Nemotelus uliginosus]|uniref:hypothetical protein n=1 Tax=Candidatus Tisiphia endosymbiont of Nemotelus uliginosus TaxID=3077926 RepID=UPI0035C8F77A
MDIYIQFARSELGLGKRDKVLEYLNKARRIFLSDNSSNPKDANYSEDLGLAVSYVVEGDLLCAKNNRKKAIESYHKAYLIYLSLYGERLKNVAQVSYLYLQGATAACKTKDLYNYKFFSDQQIKEFGANHPNTITMLQYCQKYQERISNKN